jgi:pimeloyl-ACP methyl ester carboxylesterase
VSIQLQQIDGLTVASEIHGESGGEPALLLHGWGCSIENMRGVANALAPRGYLIHILDFPGFGRSAVPAEVWGVEEYAHFVVHYLDSAELRTVNLIGHSFGGRISIVLGADYAERIKKIVLTGSAGVITPPSTGQKIRSAGFGVAKALFAVPGFNALEKPFREWAKASFGSADLKSAGALEPIFRKVIQQDLVPHAAKIKAPTLLIWGDQDDAAPLWQAKVLEKTIPDAGLVIFQGAGHFAYQERLPDFVRIVDTFLGGKQ